MGTNYYLEASPPCECCGRPYERLHIGKSSYGWCFSLHVIPEYGINDLDDWSRNFQKPGAVITDEYGDTITMSEMMDIITKRSSRFGKSHSKWYETNHASPGPSGLSRHRIDRHHCIGHGEGTYDLLIGEFS